MMNNEMSTPTKRDIGYTPESPFTCRVGLCLEAQLAQPAVNDEASAMFTSAAPYVSPQPHEVVDESWPPLQSILQMLEYLAHSLPPHTLVNSDRASACPE